MSLNAEFSEECMLMRLYQLNEITLVGVTLVTLFQNPGESCDVHRLVSCSQN